MEDIDIENERIRTEQCTANLIAVRAITAFIVLESDPSSWDGVLKKAIEFCSSLSDQCASSGYAVQSLRLITNPFGEYLDTSCAENAVAGLKMLEVQLLALEKASGIRIRFSIGAARTVEEIKLIPLFIKEAGDLANCCINVPFSKDGILDFEMVTAGAEVCESLGQETIRGEGNFNFTINFNGPHLCPYFPAGFNTKELGESFVIGLEYPDLLVHLLEKMVPPGASSIVVTPALRESAWMKAAADMKAAVETHVAVLAGLAHATAVTSGRSFAGIDSSPAPSKNVCAV